MFYTMKSEAVAARVKKMIEKKQEFMADVNNCHVKLMKGNVKTGKKCWTVSLIPVADCGNCAACKNDCYDVRNDCLYAGVQNSRALNSAIHTKDIKRYWDEISQEVKKNKVTQLRINVGGDLNYEDFKHVARIASENPGCSFLFFTKNYSDYNKFIADGNSFPSNVSTLFSRWGGLNCDNPNKIPESHVVYRDKSGNITATTAPQEYFHCPGNCSDCHDAKIGCWALKPGECVGFDAH